MFLLVPAYPGCPGQTAIKWLLLLLHSFRFTFLAAAINTVPANSVTYTIAEK